VKYRAKRRLVAKTISAVAAAAVTANYITIII